jgi:hypothetical protein
MDQCRFLDQNQKIRLVDSWNPPISKTQTDPKVFVRYSNHLKTLSAHTVDEF